VVVGVLVMLVLAAGAYVVVFRVHRSPGTTAAPPPTRIPCPTSPDVVGGRPRIVVRNASLRTGLAAGVAHQLRRHDFAVGSIGNADKLERDVALIRYPASAKLTATTLARYVPGARLQQASLGQVELDIGTKFAALASRRAIAISDRLRRQADRAQTCAASQAHD
jgi:hypothetical protein